MENYNPGPSIANIILLSIAQTITKISDSILPNAVFGFGSTGNMLSIVKVTKSRWVMFLSGSFD